MEKKSTGGVSMNCSCCGKLIIPGTETHLRKEWKKNDWTFCNDCVVTGKARKWGEKKEAEGRQMK